MREKFNNKYRIPSARLQTWDYSAEGVYFITICTDNRTHFFGECANGKMKLTTVGAIVQGFWFEIPKHFPFVELGEFVVMPNHIHGIVIINKNAQSDIERDIERDLNCGAERDLERDAERDAERDVETLHCNVSTKTEFFKNISPKPGSIAAIVRSYKSICTKHIHQSFPDLNFEWQTRYWDNIVQNGTAYEYISHYIISNPENWQKDQFLE